MVTRCFRALSMLLSEIEDMESSDYQKDKIFLSLMLSVNTVETFINVYFRVIAEQEKFATSKDMILSDLSHDNGSKALGLKSKLNNWPPKVLGKSVNWSSGVGSEFEELRKKRNKLMHFISGYETLEFDNIKIHGLSNTSDFDNLSYADATNSYRVAFLFVEYILKLAGTSEKNLPHAMHHWAGIPPMVATET